jgi:pyruvate-formate lyase-activating enzyme
MKNLISIKNENKFDRPNLKSRIQINRDGSIYYTDQWSQASTLPSQSLQVLEFPGAQSSTKPKGAQNIGIIHAGTLLGEEAEISGLKGSNEGTSALYFHGCELRCTHCYQPEFFAKSAPHYVSQSEVLNFMQLQENTPIKTHLFVASHYIESVYQIAQRAKTQGIKKPLVYKHSGIIAPHQIERLAPVIDIFLPDLKAITLDYAKLQGLSQNHIDQSLISLIKTLNLGKRVIARFLFIPSFQNFPREISSLIDKLGPTVSGNPLFSLSFLTLFYNSDRKIIEKTSHSIVEECRSLLESRSIDVIIENNTHFDNDDKNGKDEKMNRKTIDTEVKSK